MKKTTVLFSSFIILLISCKKNNEPTVQQNEEAISASTMNSISDELSTDKLFIEFYTNIQSQPSKIKNIQKIKEAISDNSISNQEEIEIYHFMGFPDKSNFLLFQKRQQYLGQYINNRYQLNKLSSNTSRKIIENAIKGNLSNSTIEKFLEDADLCERARLACLASVAAQATIMNLGCILSDATGPLGVLCHAAVLVYQTSESAQCNITAEQCKKSQQTIVIE